jgi:hypothetical protein
MTDTQDIYQRLGEQVGEVVKKAVKQAFIMQGRNLTSALVNSIDYSVNATVTSAFIEFTLLDYGMILNYGVPANRIPFSPGSGAKSSKYIDGLKMYAKLRFNANDKEAERIAFAIARKHKKFGMPLDGKTGAVEKGIKESSDEVEALISEALTKVINVMFLSSFAEVKKKNSNSLKIKYFEQ